MNGERKREMADAFAAQVDAIQPHGWLIVCDAAAAKVRRHSANLSDLFPSCPEPFIGVALRDILGPEVTHSLRNALSRNATPSPPALLMAVRFPGREGAFDLSVHATDDETLIEIEPAGAESDRSLLDRLRASVARIGQAGEVDRLLRIAARLTFSMLQYDRVAVLRFDSAGRPVIVAEQKSPDLESWAEGACPIESFAEATRAKYLAAGFRVIVDADAPPAKILASPDAAPLDLTFAFLSAASHDEREILRRSGAVAALAMPLVVDGQLWGLILSHHHEPRHPAMDLRAVAELFGQYVSLRLQILLARRVKEDRPTRPPKRAKRLRVMIVEDQVLIAMDLEASLIENGDIVACVCASAAQALEALEGAAIDVAILDFYLDGETSVAVAEALEKRGIPFIFATGQGDETAMPPRFAGKALVRKPYDVDQIMTALRKALAGRG
jgi:light-regulated signal transduction histidine kinase (bacteriophytochrome)